MEGLKEGRIPSWDMIRKFIAKKVSKFKLVSKKRRLDDWSELSPKERQKLYQAKFTKNGVRLTAGTITTYNSTN